MRVLNRVAESRDEEVACVVVGFRKRCPTSVQYILYSEGMEVCAEGIRVIGYTAAQSSRTDHT